MKYETKPIIVDAILFKYEKVSAVEDFLGHAIFDLCKERSTIDKNVKYYFNLPTLDGYIKVMEGDYIIRYPSGDLCVRKPSAFKAMYTKIK